MCYFVIDQYSCPACIHDNLTLASFVNHTYGFQGNMFVKQEKWDEAISCYNRAIELVKDDCIYFANRGLCYLKKDRLVKGNSGNSVTKNTFYIFDLNLF